MRFAPLLFSALALSLLAAPAAAIVTEPNGLQVPVMQPSSEIRLDAFFASKGEAIDWQADAHATPNAFSPLCGFTATFVLNQAGSKFGLAWYNETGTPPQASDLHQIVPAGAPLGQAIMGATIKSDPAYAGGLVGFALEVTGTGEVAHFTNASYDTNCTACNPAGHWITALIYASKNTPNAYYIGFEDGATNAGSWNNDGDFNDDVFFLTGLTCSGGGQTCDTGQPGICGPGVTQCTASGVVCQQLSQPKAEACNGLDDDCNGQIDEGDLCPSGFICDKGTCVQSCQGGEFNCPPSKICTTDGHCVDPACKDVNCDPGKVCVGGTCNGPCDGVVCPFNQVCRVGECVDPCAGVTCDQSQVCDGGVCVARCDCLPCTAGKACDAMSGVCGDPLCVGTPPCDPGKHCLGGTCVDACMGVTCPSGQACMSGQCVQVQGTTGTGGSSSVGFGVGVGGNNGAGGKSGSGGKSGTGGSNAGGAFTTTGGNGTAGKCGCEVVGAESDSGALAWLALSALGLVAARRRR